MDQARRNRVIKQRKVRRGQEARHQIRRLETDDEERDYNLPEERAEKSPWKVLAL